MSKVEAFLSPTEEQEIIKAIRTAEGSTSGEIRIHMENSCTIGVQQRARQVFHMLKMDTTKLANGVLIYVAVVDKKFAIYGDVGINKVVVPDFWESTKNTIQKHFRTHNFKQGLIDGVLLVGQQLQAYFPWDAADDNELSDEISKG